MNELQKFKKHVFDNIQRMGNDEDIKSLSKNWLRATANYNYTYNFKWMDMPIIQVPQDIVAMQELIWNVKPDLIIETGIAYGGSLIFSASMLAQLDICEAIELGESIDPRKSQRKVLGIDIDIRTHNCLAIKTHPMASRIQMIEGSSIAPDIISQVHEIASDYKRILVCLDSNHTHDHVLEELKAYAPLTSVGSYCVVFDTLIEDMPTDMFPDRPWDKRNNPKTAVWEYLRILKEESRESVDGTRLAFEIDKIIENKLLITVAPDGFLRRVKS